MVDPFTGLTPLIIFGIIFAAFATAAIHGATGVAGGILMTAILASVLGVKPVVPVMSVVLLISHISRVYLNRGDFDRTVFLSIQLPAVIFTIVTASLYVRMTPTLVAITLGLVILVSVPIRHWAFTQKIAATRKTLYGAGVVYGIFSGVSIGPGMMLTPFMLGYGLSRQGFVATLAAIALASNVIRITVFGSADLLNGGYLMLGVILGLISIPGNLAGRFILRKMSNEDHSRIVDGLTIVCALNFFWLAYRG